MLAVIAGAAAAAMSTAAFIAFGADKRFAVNNKRRISEKMLMLLCLFMGGAGGLLGMLAFNHKTRKPKFYIGVPFCAILNAAIIIILAIYM